MIRIFFGVILICYCTSPFAHDTLISLAIPYSSGIVHLNADSDTVSFSNGVRFFSLVFSPCYQIPEDSTWDGGIAFLYSFGKMVYKNDSSLIRRWDHDLQPHPEEISSIHMAQWTMTIGNPDTNWATSLRLPQAIYPADSLLLRTSETEISLLTAKHVYYSQKPVGEIVRTIGTTVSANANSIMYFIASVPSSPNMKFQVASVSKDSSSMVTVPSLGTYKNYIASGMMIHWMIDSLGNGMFYQSVNVTMSPGNITNSSVKKSFKFLNLNDFEQSKAIGNRAADNRTIISLKGAKIFGNKSFGIFIIP